MRKTLFGQGIENTTPILRVEDLSRSINHYISTLGFSVDWQYSGAAGMVRDGKGLMLLERTQGNPGTWPWIGVHHAQAIYSEFVAKGANIRHPPPQLPLDAGIQSRNPDVHVLRIGSGPIDRREFNDWKQHEQHARMLTNQPATYYP